MQPDDFFSYEDPLVAGDPTISRIDLDLLQRIRTGGSLEQEDIEVAVPLARLIHDEFELYGTDGSEQITNDESRELLRALKAVVVRLGIEDFSPPFRDLSTFRTWWISEGATNSGGWAARRLLLRNVFDSLHERLFEIEELSETSRLAEGISPHGEIGWPDVDRAVAELRRHFRSARSDVDYRNVGNDCVLVLERLSAHAYDPAKHLPAGETEPPVDQTKKRLEAVISAELAGDANDGTRKLARGAIELAHSVKHRPTPSRRDAGIAGDAVILLANILRRLEDR